MIRTTPNVPTTSHYTNLTFAKRYFGNPGPTQTIPIPPRPKSYEWINAVFDARLTPFEDVPHVLMRVLVGEQIKIQMAMQDYEEHMRTFRQDVCFRREPEKPARWFSEASVREVLSSAPSGSGKRLDAQKIDLALRELRFFHEHAGLDMIHVKRQQRWPWQEGLAPGIYYKFRSEAIFEYVKKKLGMDDP